MEKKPLKILIIEDIEERQKILTSLYRSHAWILVKTGHRAVTLLSAYDFDIISLDYNLAGEINGAEVALALSHACNQNPRIIIHSLNPKGVEQILKILPHAIPYQISKMISSNQKFKYLRSKIDELGAAFDWS